VRLHRISYDILFLSYVPTTIAWRTRAACGQSFGCWTRRRLCRHRRLADQHPCLQRSTTTTTTIYDLQYIRRCTKKFTPRRTRYAGRPTFERYYYINIIKWGRGAIGWQYFTAILSLSQLCCTELYNIVFIILRLRSAFGERPVADFVSFLCFVVFACVYNTRVLSNARRGGGGQERAFGEITERIDFSTTPLVARNGSAGVTSRGCRRARPPLLSSARPAPPTPGLPAPRATVQYMCSLKILYIIVSTREGCALTIWGGRSLKRSGRRRRHRRSRTNLRPRGFLCWLPTVYNMRPSVEAAVWSSELSYTYYNAQTILKLVRYSMAYSRLQSSYHGNGIII